MAVTDKAIYSLFYSDQLKHVILIYYLATLNDLLVFITQ